MLHRGHRGLCGALLLPLLASCGGGSDPWRQETAGAARGPQARAATVPPTESERIAAAKATAKGSLCSLIRPFYWEIGDGTGRKVGGALNSSSSTLSYSAKTPLPYTSASKWLYGAYVAERRAGKLNPDDIRMLTLRSGYHSLTFCAPWQTVDQCLAYGSNGDYDASADGKYFYDGAHLQKHASVAGLGAKTTGGLANAVKGKLGDDIAIKYSQPQPAGAAVGTPDDYARFLRKLLNGQLYLSALLGSNAVCTSSRVCPGQAIFNPMPADEAWEYSIAHWIESDPVKGDGSFSSPGVSGFYPWIDASRTYYGIVARNVTNGVPESVHCGQAIRAAWLTGIAR